MPKFQKGLLIVLGTVASMGFKETGFCAIFFVLLLDCILVPQEKAKKKKKEENSDAVKVLNAYRIGLIVALSIILKLRYDHTDGTGFSINSEFNYIIAAEDGVEKIFRIMICHVRVLKYCFYVGETLSIDHKVDLEITFKLVMEVAGVYLGCLLYLVVVVRRVFKPGSGWFHKINLLSTSLFVIFYLPSSQIFFLVGFYIAERNMFVSCLGACLIFSNYLNLGVQSKLREGFGLGKKRCRAITLLITMLVCLWYARVINVESKYWLNNETLSLRTLETNPRSFNALRGLGLESYRGQDWEVAEAYYEKAILLKEGKNLVLSDYAMAGKVGLARFIFEGKSDEEHVEKTVGYLREASKEWNYLQGRATHDLGYFLWWGLGDREESVSALIGVVNHVSMFPTLSRREIGMAFNNAGCGVMLGRGNAREASELFVEGLSNLDVGEEAWFIHMNNLVVALVRDGREEEGLQMLEKMKEVGGGVKGGGGEYRSADGFIDTEAGLRDDCIWDYVK
ncbi:hypothetical protein TrVE_jg13894 [Triparma verrucosa]|uniref:Uncharacterized protein n=1 Tax=Triparma verrucosa TaxID=1606542 RepID=A0A9W7BXZ7_9STRA|nr:hypothetical protein TrVE_jg13894 [Triparma verrucosa]